jgi:hypothetical protein
MPATFSKALKYCSQLYGKNLLVSNTLSTMALLGVGDLLTQYVDIRMTRRALKNLDEKDRLMSEDVRKKDMDELMSKSDFQFIYLEKFDWARTGRFQNISSFFFFSIKCH